MKKFYSVLFFIIVTLLIIGCNGKGDKKLDFVWSGLEEQVVIRGDTVDLLAGITVIDSSGEDVSENIEIVDNGDFTSELAGGYVVTYSVTNSRGKIDTQNKKFKVIIGHNVANGNFDFLQFGWKLDTPGGIATSNYTNGKAIINITNPGTGWWSIQLYQTDIIFEAGKTYKLTVKASSPDERSIAAGFEDVNSGYKMMGPGFMSMQLSKEMTEYSLYYTAITKFTNVKVVLYLGYQLEVDQITVGSHSIVIEDVNIEMVDVKQNIDFKGITAVSKFSDDEPFDPLLGVTAVDSKGNDYTDKIEVFGFVPNSVQLASNYFIQYRVQLDDGSFSYANRKINIELKKDFPYQAVNGDFEKGFTGWVQDVNQTSGTGKAEFIANDDGTVSVKVINVSDVGWHIQLYQATSNFKQGESYTLRIKVKADQNRKAVLEVVDPQNNFTDIAKKLTIDITTEWNTYELKFIASKDYYGAKISILLGNVDMLQKSNVVVTIDEFQVYR